MRLRELGVTVPVIGFPRGAARVLIEPMRRRSDVQGSGSDTSAPLELGRRLQAKRTIQGALDPLLLRAGGAALDRRVDALLAGLGRAGRTIFNLGHGVVPDTPIAHVEATLRRITGPERAHVESAHV